MKTPQQLRQWALSSSAKTIDKQKRNIADAQIMHIARMAELCEVSNSVIQQAKLEASRAKDQVEYFSQEMNKARADVIAKYARKAAADAVHRSHVAPYKTGGMKSEHFGTVLFFLMVTCFVASIVSAIS